MSKLQEIALDLLQLQERGCDESVIKICKENLLKNAIKSAVTPKKISSLSDSQLEQLVGLLDSFGLI